MSNTPDSTELLPCPFCGQQDAFVEQLDSDASVVICQGLVGEHAACLARGPVGLREHELEDQPGRNAAVREWNSRAQPADQQGEPDFYEVSGNGVRPALFYEKPEWAIEDPVYTVTRLYRYAQPATAKVCRRVKRS